MSVDITELLATRVHEPGRVAELFGVQGPTRPADRRNRAADVEVAADHPARGALRAGQDAFAMADR